MKVSKLIEFLSSCDPDAEVLLVTQSSYPFECSTSGFCTREQLADHLEAEYDDQLTTGGKLSDVLITEGSQIRYGSKHTWNVRS